MLLALDTSTLTLSLALLSPDLTVREQPERTAVVGFAEIECQAVRVGESCELCQGKITEETVREQIG